ncbi:polysaccharide pyruvyl transferase family protein [Rivularia sp. UHCC 0363]|uniref:polysaccharide pyruvyl transferase family protein n=1 Tax=Rivularia sp. UHCC 0363 TaxID=3110244 RepID=UPI002B21F5A8|nr:polysaccharide pyruvyl transferase family protein [Rivularia sp. UHCC 0363]MEA5598883.1 polysaccharide pyruvyl transferase family protein [Rivularia sp. UHCC 0363]
MKVAIWGSYNYGNYGDDIMAVQFAKHLKNLDVKPVIYRLDKQLAQRYQLQTTDSLDELLNDAKFCIIGGGGFLVENFSAPFEADFRRLQIVSTEKNCPVYPISIGGEGLGANAKLSYWRREFFQGDMCQCCTVRLESDRDLINMFGKEVFYYPDVLLSVPKFWQIPHQNKQSNVINVGINIPQTLQCQWLALQLKFIASIRRDIVFHFIKTYLPSSPINSELQPKQSKNIKHHVYTDPQSTLEFLATLDLVVSYKLHLGLTALTLGVPFYSLGGSGKAKAFLNSIGADFAVGIPADKRFKLAAFLSNPQNILQAKNKFNFTIIDKLGKNSLGHLNFLSNLVKNVSSSCSR